MDEFGREALREWEVLRSRRLRVFWLHATIWAATGLLLVVIWAATGAGFPWFLFPVFGWLVGLTAHGAAAWLIRSPEELLLRREQAREISGSG